MAAEPNPYAPPTLTADEPPRPPAHRVRGGAGVWREGDLLVLDKTAALFPPRCVVCNRDTDYKLKRIFIWHPRWIYLLAPLGGILYALIAASVRKYATVEVGLCDEHQLRRRSGLLLLGFGVGASVLLLLIASSSRWGSLAIAALAGMIVALVVGSRMSRVAVATKIDDTHAWLRVGQPFLASLPDSPDAAPEPPRRKKKKKKATKPAPDAAATPATAGPEPDAGPEDPDSALAAPAPTRDAEPGNSPEDP